MDIIDKIKNNLKLEPEIIKLMQKLNYRGNQCLVIGGAVRDSILGIEAKDIDIEVYGISYEDLMKFLSQYGKVDLVGQKFGVIIFNPYNGKMKYDFSIPRTESKIGVGHNAFNILLDSNLSIKDASERRDFSFNALAYDPIEDQIYDYFGGLDDLKNKIIRHTSDAFSEDYLRILRCFQFQARLDFTIHPDTITLMKKMLTDNPNEFRELAIERVGEEWLKWSEKGIRHDLIFKFMRDTGLIDFYPELKALKETPQDKIYHPEGDVEVHTELCLIHMDKVIERENITGTKKVIMVASILLHDVAKPPTTKEEMKRGRMMITSNGHEEMGGEMAKVFLSGIGFHAELIEPISNLIANHLAGVKIAHITVLSGKTKFIKKLSRKLHPATIQQLLFICESDTNGRGDDSFKIATGSDDIREIANQVTVIDKQYEYIIMGRHLIEWYNLKPSKEFGIILGKANEAQENGFINDLESGKKWLNDNLELLTNKK